MQSEREKETAWTKQITRRGEEEEKKKLDKSMRNGSIDEGGKKISSIKRANQLS